MLVYYKMLNLPLVLSLSEAVSLAIEKFSVAISAFLLSLLPTVTLSVDGVFVSFGGELTGTCSPIDSCWSLPSVGIYDFANSEMYANIIEAMKNKINR